MKFGGVIIVAMFKVYTDWKGTEYCRFGNFRENLFSRIALKDILVMWKIRDLGKIYLFQ